MKQKCGQGSIDLPDLNIWRNLHILRGTFGKILHGQQISELRSIALRHYILDLSDIFIFKFLQFLIHLFLTLRQMPWLNTASVCSAIYDFNTFPISLFISSREGFPASRVSMTIVPYPSIILRILLKSCAIPPPECRLPPSSGRGGVGLPAYCAP